MFLCVFVVVDTHEQEVVSIFQHFTLVFLATYLFYCCVGIFVIFQLNNHCWKINMLAGNEHKIGKSFARRQFAMNDVVILSIDVSDRKNTRERVFIVVR